MDYLPIFLKLDGRSCAVIGGGEVAARKAGLLLEAGARVTVTAPELCEALAELAQQGRIAHRARAFDPVALDGASVVIAATDDRAVNAEVSRLAQQSRIPVNVVDDPELCSFILPAIVDRSPVVVAVSTGGSTPVLARLLRARLETLIPAAYGELASLAQRFRGRVKEALPQPRRRPFWERVLTVVCDWLPPWSPPPPPAAPPAPPWPPPTPVVALMDPDTPMRESLSRTMLT